MTRDDARRAHAIAEVATFALKPWETLPMNAGGDPPAASDDSMGARTWARARALRLQLLAANPDHYADIGE